MGNHLVSIITPSYNSSKYISKTIESVLAQSYLNLEMVIVDDFSKDNSTEVIKKFVLEDSRIRLIVLDNNVGAAEARNIALRQAKGRYIAFLDSDDVWTKDKLNRQLSFMSSNNYLFTFTAYGLMNEDGTIQNKTINVPKLITYDKYLKNTIIGCLTVVIDREQIGPFEFPNIKSSHDMGLWLQILRKGFVAYGLNEELAFYRIVRNSNTANKKKAALDVWHVYREIEKLSIFYSIICFCGYAINALKKRML